jgi:hypothetical protein
MILSAFLNELCAQMLTVLGTLAIVVCAFGFLARKRAE